MAVNESSGALSSPFLEGKQDDRWTEVDVETRGGQLEELWEQKEELDGGVSAAVVYISEGTLLFRVGHRFAFVREQVARADNAEVLDLHEFSHGTVQDDNWLIDLSTLPHREGCNLSMLEKAGITEEGADAPGGAVFY